jgi:hypothetical protein
LKGQIFYENAGLRQITVNGGFPGGLDELPGHHPATGQMFPLGHATNDEFAWLRAPAPAQLCTLRNPCR